MSCKTTTILLTAALAAFGQGSVDPKGIFVTPGNNNPRPAVKYGIRLSRNGEARPVAASYRFQSGDRFQFQFEVSQSSYLYLLQREIEGDPASMEQYVGAKGIVVVRDEDDKRPASSKYQLLWPVNSSSVRLTGHQPQTVPSQGQFFQLDNRPGLEKIVMVVSPKPLDLESEFPGATGAAPRKRNDSDADVLGQLRKNLDAMEGNTASSAAVESKGICVGDCNSYSAPRNPSDPFLVVIDLRHFR
jgi:Domain of unknown function (DUF4384)